MVQGQRPDLYQQGATPRRGHEHQIDINMAKLLFRLFIPIVLGISLALNVALYSQSQTYYTESSAVRLDPIGLNIVWPAVTSGDKPIAVLFGDSRAAMWTAPSEFLPEWYFVKRGIGNQTSVQAAARFEAHVAALKPRLVIIQVGINDLKAIPLFPERKAEIIANCIANIHGLVERTRAIGSHVIVSTIFPLGDIPLTRRLVWSADVSEALDEVNLAIRGLAGDGVQILDTGVVLSDERGLVRREYQFDFLHINEAGYSALNAELIKLLR